MLVWYSNVIVYDCDKIDMIEAIQGTNQFHNTNKKKLKELKDQYWHYIIMVEGRR